MAGSQKFSSSSSSSNLPKPGVILAVGGSSSLVVSPLTETLGFRLGLAQPRSNGGLVDGGRRRAASPTVATYLAEQLRQNSSEVRRSPQVRERSRSPLNLTVSPSSRRSTADSTPTAPSPACSESSTATNPIKSKLQDFFSVSETIVGVVEDKTRSLCHFYLGLTSTDKLNFLRILAVDYGTDRRLVHQLSAHVANSLTGRRYSSELVSVRAMERLRQAILPRYQTLFTQIGRLDNGVKFIANLRADVIGALRHPAADQDCPHLITLNSTLHQLLSVWLSLGGLQLERITWQTPCDLLQKISAYEAVQPIRNLAELRRRVGPYKRCFCFTHSAMPREPLIVVHTALTQSISHTIQSIVGGSGARGGGPGDSDCSTAGDDAQMAVEDSKLVNAAVFYSITSTQRGLQGVELGGQVIKSVMLDLVNEFPRLHQFASLSPVPGFRDWLVEEINAYLRLREMNEEPTHLLLTSFELVEMSALFNVSEALVYTVLRDIIAHDEWIEQPHIVNILQAPLLRLCARYLYVEKKRGFAINPVANFHLHNGAVLWRLNWLADTTPRGVAVSCTIMANYRYYLDETDSNRRKYIENQVLTASDQVLDLLRQLPQPVGRLTRDLASISTGR